MARKPANTEPPGIWDIWKTCPAANVNHWLDVSHTGKSCANAVASQEVLLYAVSMACMQLSLYEPGGILKQFQPAEVEHTTLLSCPAALFPKIPACMTWSTLSVTMALSCEAVATVPVSVVYMGCILAQTSEYSTGLSRRRRSSHRVSPESQRRLDTGTLSMPPVSTGCTSLPPGICDRRVVCMLWKSHCGGNS